MRVCFVFVATKTVAKLSQNIAKSLRFQAKSTPSLRFVLLLVILLAHSLCVFCSCIFALLHLFRQRFVFGEVLQNLFFLCMSYYRLITGLFLVLCARLWFGGVWISVQNGQK